MASRDLTATFIERRAAANLRRRNERTANGNDGSKRMVAGGTDDHLLMEVRR
eukprot:CAMPEP_0202449358 /NCGR_PEP_ID=MMETSP1360-20130828/8092_1 /ASSEMBLY_ACC=CAM_ASM_000848 /TAXON_ID=515479 /ORGANISM="Licmophora paradoxa, Strain CCMP2313" /LENGTH=51 /DNA_ID=CAMNT_0049067251 /DNA_START=55 /DNA_END=210 /DNA_ORIENTATION=-